LVASISWTSTTSWRNSAPTRPMPLSAGLKASRWTIRELDRPADGEPAGRNPRRVPSSDADRPQYATGTLDIEPRDACATAAECRPTLRIGNVRDCKPSAISRASPRRHCLYLAPSKLIPLYGLEFGSACLQAERAAKDRTTTRNIALNINRQLSSPLEFLYIVDSAYRRQGAGQSSCAVSPSNKAHASFQVPSGCRQLVKWRCSV
jgi:hypothetical protein